MGDDSGIWEALGRYIFQSFSKKKGVMIPGFGTFTYTTQVSLDGINSALTKNRDDRSPVFIVSSELAPGIRSGIAHDSGIRPYTNKGVSGVTPTVKLNLAELSQLSGLSKDETKKRLDEAIRKFAENIKKGDARVEIPGIGSLVCKNNITAVIFNKKFEPVIGPGTLTEDGEKWLKDNLKIDLPYKGQNIETPPEKNLSYQQFVKSIDIPQEKFKEFSRPQSSENFLSHKIDGFSSMPRKTVSSLKMESVDSNFLKLPIKEPSSNIDFILENESKLRLIFSLKDPGNQGLLDLEDFVQALNMLQNPNLTEPAINKLISISGCKSSNKIRYNLFIEYLAKQRSQPKKLIESVRSDYTANYNRSTVIPLAKKIWKKRIEFTKQSQEGGMRPRVTCSASELLSILKKSEVDLNIHQLKAVLRECGFIQASPLDLIKAVRNILAPESSNISVFSEIQSQASSFAPIRDENMEIVKKYLKDYNLQEFYRKASKQNGLLDVDDFVEYITQQSRGAVKGFEAEHAFRKAAKNKAKISESEFCSAFGIVQNTKKVETSSIDKVKNWLKTNRFSSLQGYNKLLEYAGTSDSLTKEQFGKAMTRLNIQPRESEIFFRLLDTKNDGKLDQNEWKAKLYEENIELNEMRDTIMAYGLDPNEILMKMDLKGRTKLTSQEICLALQRIDPSLNSRKAVEIASSLTGLNSEINVNDFIEKISGQPDLNWLKNLLEKVKNKGNYETVKKMFEEADPRCMGKLDIITFSDIVNKAGLGLSIADIEKLGRTFDRGMNSIDYLQFLEKIKPKAYISDPYKVLLSRLFVYLKQNNLRPEDFLLKMGGRVSVKNFAEFLSTKINKDLSKEDSFATAQKFDVNEDGWIDITDFMTSLDKNKEIQETIQISSEKSALILADVRKALGAKKLNYQEAFNFFDTEKNGLISCKEFCDGLGKLVDISDSVKQGLFEFIDKQHIGLINFDSFAEVLKYSDIKVPKTNDSWDWENEALDKIRTWIVKENLTVEEAFRAFDKDFDGVISKTDLKNALTAILKIKEADISSSKIERVYKLMDIYKRDSIQLSDFKCIFEEQRSPEWKDSVKQSIGLFISKNYENSKEAFITVSGNTEKITFELFSKWTNETLVLTDYRLTTQLLQELFAYLDPHKKGFLTKEDWYLCFGSFNHSNLQIQEVKDAIRTNFSDVKTAFDYFLTFHTGTPPDKISIKDFEKAVEAMIPKRFGKKDVFSIWKKLFFDNSFISFKEFKEAFDEGRFLSTFAPSKGKPSSARTSLTSSSAKSNLSEDPLKRLQALIRASPYSIEDIFKKMDSDHSGTLSLIEFRNAMRKLNIGLSAKDIDGVLARIDKNNDGQIDWQEFSQQFKSTETENHIKASCQQRLNSLRLLMTSFMLSARDAFNQFDPERTGKLTFNSFTALIQRLCELSKEPVPAFPVIKDLFDIIDIRKDGYLDMREWLNTFKDSEKTTWEDSKQYEEIVGKISKNRKMLLDSFEQVGRNGKAEYEKAKEVLGTAIRDILLNEEQWRKIIGVACRDNLVDYKSLLDIYKQRCTSAQLHPR